MKAKTAKRGVKVGKVQIYVSPQTQNSDRPWWLTTQSAIAALVVATASLAGGAWLGITLIVNPNAVAVVNRFLPAGTRFPVPVQEIPQTLTQIKAEIESQGLIPGETLSLKTDNESFEAVLLPVLVSPSDCESQCERIVELRVYQPSEAQDLYRLASKLPITGPDRSFVFASLNNTDSEEIESYRSLPITKLSRFDVQNTPGVWLNVSGETTWKNTPITYGKILHYNPKSHYLSLMEPWVSPAAEDPYWQEVTGGKTPELIVNQTVGLEPLLRVYQIVPRNFQPDPVILEEIFLGDVALEEQSYRDALTLAQAGLWSDAWKLMQGFLKKELPSTARSQIDLIRLHHQLIESESKKTWASPGQQVLSYLINGRWKEAIDVFRSSVSSYRYEMAMSLKNDSGRLWKRVEAALKVNPNSTEVKAWGALLLTAQQGRSQAINWLIKQESNSLETVAEVEGILEQLELAIADAETKQTHFSQIVGSATPLERVNPIDWLLPEETAIANTASLTLDPHQVWYRVQVNAFNDGKSWQKAPFSTLKRPLVEPGKQLWKLLGLDTDSRIVLTVWKLDGSQESTVATVKAIQLNNGVLQLLAASESFPESTSQAKAIPQILAHTQTALQWFEPNEIAISELNQQKPKWVSAILPKVWRELQLAGHVKSGKSPSLPVLMQRTGNWSVQAIDLNGNKEPEAVMTISQDLIKALNFPGKNNQAFKQRTLIFSDKGDLIYSEFTKNAKESLAAIADLGEGNLPRLVINDSQKYSLKAWSAQRKQIE